MAKPVEFYRAKQEGLTKYQGTISSDHAYIHDGKAFTAVVDLGTISVTTRIGFTTPTVASGKFIHWRPLGVQTSADYVKFVVTEDDTYTGGTAITPINRNRISSATSTMQSFQTGVTSTPAGIVIQISGVGVSGTPVSQAGGGGGAEQEIVLKQDTDYVITAVPDGATQVLATLFWYEENAGID